MKKLLPSLLLVLFCSTLFAQDTDNDSHKKSKNPFARRLFTGGNFGLQFGTVTLIDVSPILGYRVSDRFSAGLGGVYTYVRVNTGTQSYSSSVFGPQAYAHFLVTEQFFAEANGRLLSVDVYRQVGHDYQREWVPLLYIGAGYRSEIGSNAWLNMAFMYDIISDPRSPYSSRLLPRVGVVAGI